MDKLTPLIEDIFESIPIAMMIVDANGRILRMNKRQEEQSHISRNKVIGTLYHETWSVLMEQQSYDEYYWNLLKNDIPYSVVFHDFKPQFFDLRVSGISYGVPISSSDNYLLIHDVSEQIQFNKRTMNQLNIQLSQNSTLLRSILDSSPHAVLTINEQGTMLTVNKTAEVLFDRKKGEFLWQNLSTLFIDRFEKTEIDLLVKSHSGMTVQCRKNNDQVFPARIKLNPVRSKKNEKQSYLVILEDQTYQLAIESALSERLEFERVLSGLFAAFINIQPEDLNEKFDSALSSIGQGLNIDRCYLIQFDQGLDTFSISHSWAAKEIAPIRVGITQDSLSRLHRLINEKKLVQINSLDDIPGEGADSDIERDLKAKSLIYIPFVHEQKPIGALGMEQVRYEKIWNHELVNRTRIIGEVLLNVLLKTQSEAKLRQAFQEIKHLKDQLEVERNYLLDEIKQEYNFEEIIGQSLPLQKMFQDIEEVAPTDTTVLILGETGTGKELIARAIHSKSNRSDRPLIKVNCACLATNLIESELFGHVKGSFTGAHTDRKGRFEMADNATLFLDEIGELPLETQSKLLRVLQENEFERLGNSQTIRVNIRLLVATNRNLEEEVKAGRFREDLWYRLNVFPIKAPPLHERKGDIPLLVNWMIKKFGKQMGKQIESISLDAVKTLEEYLWPGNIRELQNVIERAVIKSQGGVLEVMDHLEVAQRKDSLETSSPSLAEKERAYILEILDKKNWRIAGKNGAAFILGLPESTLRAKMKKLQIKKPQ